MTTNKTTLLVIDDDEHLFRAIRALALAELGPDFVVLHASSGQAALSMMETEDIALCFLDFRMPDMDGLAVLEVLREQYAYIPIIFISGFWFTVFKYIVITLFGDVPDGPILEKRPFFSLFSMQFILLE
ncbi:MAG: response regulator [Candidatus Omnitrophota bacterium]|jgi:CheY-like chemotaxis protein|nr:MAG: response regulator [Candidatus Omnitrophota bacterium]